MTTPLRRLVSCVLCLAIVFICPAPGESRPGLRTNVRLLADTHAAVPGGTLTVGILMNMEKGWHTYWKNPGEAGLPTQVAWNMPDGFSAGEIEWPVPEKFVEAGDVMTYGYAGETMLLVPVAVPVSAVPGRTVTITAHVEWLECERTCVPGDVTLQVTLPVAAVSPGSSNGALFARYRDQLPRPFVPEGPVDLRTSLGRGVVELLLSPKAPGTLMAGNANSPDFYPEPLENIVVGRTAVAAAGEGVLMKIPLSALHPTAGPLKLRGIVSYTPKNGTRHRETLEIPLPPAFCATLPSATTATLPKTSSLLEQTFETTESSAGGQPFLLYILFAVLGGVLLNIMPCVLPVIALKIFGLVKMAGDQPARIKRLGWAFSAGILASFLALAILVIILKLAGQQVGWGFQFQEPLFVIVMAAVVFAFGLSLFGVYEIQLPGAAISSISTLVTQQQRSGTGYQASFAEGVFATILATPCTAPFLGSALGFAFAQSWWIILLIFASVALGMALPYLILTARPAWLKFLPKPGVWMETAKQFMGFLMMATLLWLLYILGRQLGMEAVIWTGAFLIAIGIACWLIGRFATLTASRLVFRLTYGAALVIVVSGYVIFLESALNVRAVIAGVPETGTSGSVVEEGISWKPFTLASLEMDILGERPVFVDFTAEWCLTCKVNERTVLASREVIEKFRSLKVVAVKADWTNRNPDITKLLAKFGRSGVPLYVIFPPGKPAAPTVLPEIISAGMVIEALDRAAAR